LRLVEKSPPVSRFIAIAQQNAPLTDLTTIVTKVKDDGGQVLQTFGHFVIIGEGSAALRDALRTHTSGVALVSDPTAPHQT
jgi:hypothetical protein